MSTLNYLKDNDIIKLLEEYVLKAYLQKKQKDLDQSRDFHEKNFQECIDMNRENHYFISDIITDINIPLYFSVTPLYVPERIKLYNDTIEVYKENTKLQRCIYQ